MDPLNWRPDWSFAITTLLIRFFGIFVVLAILQIVMVISGFIFKRLAEKSAKKAPEELSDSAPSGPLPLGEEVDEKELVAAIGTALSLHESEAETTVRFPMGKASPAHSSDWTIMGRMAQLHSRVFHGRH
jgi:hypothetical protein